MHQYKNTPFSYLLWSKISRQRLKQIQKRKSSASWWQNKGATPHKYLGVGRDGSQQSAIVYPNNCLRSDSRQIFSLGEIRWMFWCVQHCTAENYKRQLGTQTCIYLRILCIYVSYIVYHIFTLSVKRHGSKDIFVRFQNCYPIDPSLTIGWKSRCTPRGSICSLKSKVKCICDCS